MRKQTKPTADPFLRDALGRVICQHETPGGAQRCALCRAEVLAIHDPNGTAIARWRNTRQMGTPMPDWFREQLHQIAAPEPIPTQPDLLEDL